MGAQFTPPPPAAITRVLSTFDRDQLAGFVAVAIDLMDLADGDPDFEDHKLEDDFTQHADDGPGCPISDSDLGVDDDDGGRDCGDRSYAEWHTLPSSARRAGRNDGKPLDARGGALDEDDEDDDPAEACGDEQDGNFTEDDFCHHGGIGPGCPFADPGEDNHDREQTEIYHTLPRYGIDQSSGPVNEREAHRVWIANMSRS